MPPDGGISFLLHPATVARFAFFFLEHPFATFGRAMAKQSLQTYLRTYRKRSNLSQDEIAYLVALVAGTTVSRHEYSRRLPSLADAFAYEVLFGLPASKLFPGVYEKARARLEIRAHRLLERLKHNGKGSPVERQKIAFLEELLRRVRM
jgi:transcriptional regulator with XRE-family HTH domain